MDKKIIFISIIIIQRWLTINAWLSLYINPLIIRVFIA